MIDIASIQTARENLRGQVLKTPFTLSRTLSDIFGAEIWLKFEDAHSKVLTIATVKIEGEDVPLSIAGKAALLDIVRDVKADQAAANRLTAKASILQALARKATGESA